MTDPILMDLIAAADAGHLAGYAAALARIPVERLNTIGKEAAFQRTVDQLAHLAQTSRAPEERLKALAMIGRGDSTAQQKQESIDDAARRAVRQQPPPPTVDDRFPSPDERYDISLVIARAVEAWVVPYAARALLNEAGETRLRNDVRAAYSALAIDRSETLTDAFLAIERAVAGSRIEDPVSPSRGCVPHLTQLPTGERRRGSWPTPPASANRSPRARSHWTRRRLLSAST